MTFRVGKPRTMRFDVCVIGGGPAGASAAIRLARLGHSVCVVEKAVSPRPHFIQSLAPGVREALSILGLPPEALDEHAVLINGLQLRWASQELENITPPPHGMGSVLDRGRFDARLQQAAMEAGVCWLAKSRVVHCVRPHRGWTLRLSGPEIARTEAAMICANYLIDAAGRNGFLPGIRHPISAPTIAICGVLVANHTTTQMRVEALRDGWCWGAPTPQGDLIAMTFVGRNPSGQLRDLGAEQRWRRMLMSATLFAPFADLQITTPLIVRDASTYNCVEPIGRDFLRVGEAQLSLDPLSSNGVNRAMHDGIAAATVVHTLLRHPDRQELCSEYYASRQNECAEHHRIWSAGFYAQVKRFSDHSFWKQRSFAVGAAPPRHGPPSDAHVLYGLNDRLFISKQVSTREIACVVGDEVCAQGALHHPELAKPVAYLHGIPVVRLLELAGESTTLKRLAASWAAFVPRHLVPAMIAWFMTHHIFERET